MDMVLKILSQIDSASIKIDTDMKRIASCYSEESRALDIIKEVRDGKTEVQIAYHKLSKLERTSSSEIAIRNNYGDFNFFLEDIIGLTLKYPNISKEIQCFGKVFKEYDDFDNLVLIGKGAMDIIYSKIVIPKSVIKELSVIHLTSTMKKSLMDAFEEYKKS